MLVKRKVESALIRKGFQRNDSHHIQFRYIAMNGQVTHVKTKISHGQSRDIGDKLAGKMARQCFLKLSEFKKLIDCSLSRSQYEEILRNSSVI